jgi:predicted MFS family arabinose efflux permease
MQQPISAAKAAEAIVPDGPVMTGQGDAAGVSTSYRTYVLVIMTLVYVVNYLDRQILGILNPQIKAEFHVSNTLIGLLNGPVFALMYATLGVPIAVLADRMNRRNVIAASMTVFSVMTFLGAFAAHFWQLALARFGTGIGEAGTGPSINSVLADLYPPQKRASALAFYSAGLNVGLLFAFFGGGWIAQHYGWRVALQVAGIPGLILTLLLLTTVKEPTRGQVEKLADKGEAPNLWTVVGYLWRQKSFRWIAFGTAMSSFGGYAGIAFVPQFLVTSHHMSLPAIGFFLSVLTGGVGAIGTYLSGVFADVFAKRDVRWNMYVLIAATFIGLPFAPVFYLSSNTTVALLAAAGPSLVGAAFIGPAYAMSQALVPLRMRARSAAILLFVLNIIALGTAAPIVGLISDLLQPTFGSDSLRYALMTGMVTAVIGAFCYWQAAKTLKSDIARVTEA